MRGAALGQHLAHQVEGRLGEGRLRDHGEDLLGAQRQHELARARHLQGRVGLGAHEIALVRQLGDRIGARRGGQEGLALPAERRHRGGHRRGPGAHDGGGLVDVDQLARSANAGFRAGLVVLAHQHDAPAQHAARLVDLLDDRRGDLGHRRAVGAAGAGERRQGGELDGVGLRTHHGGACDSGDASRQRRTTAIDPVIYCPPFPCFYSLLRSSPPLGGGWVRGLQTPSKPPHLTSPPSGGEI